MACSGTALPLPLYYMTLVLFCLVSSCGLHVNVVVDETFKSQTGRTRVLTDGPLNRQLLESEVSI
jgi:hypothetical protein